MGESLYKHCIVAGGRPCVTTQSVTRRRGAGTRAATRATQSAAGARVAKQFLYCDRGARHSAATWRASAPMRAATLLGLATIRPGRGPRHGAQRTRNLGSGCASCAPNPVLTQCTVLSHYWDTVHEHYSQGFQKK